MDVYERFAGSLGERLNWAGDPVTAAEARARYQEKQEGARVRRDLAAAVRFIVEEATTVPVATIIVPHDPLGLLRAERLA